jgi:hypothetical protein
MMSVVAQFFNEGGAFMYLLVPIGLAALGLSLAAVFFPVAPLRWAALGFAVMPLFVGVVGMALGRAKVASAIAVVEPEMRAQLQQVGLAEAQRPLQLGVGLTVLAALPVVLALYIDLSRRSETPKGSAR